MSTELKDTDNIRVLSLVPTSQGTGYALVDCPPFEILDRGILALKKGHGEHIKDLSRFLASHRPDMLLLENMQSKHFQRSEKTRVKIEALIGLSSGYGIAVQPVSREEVFTHFDIPESTSRIAVAGLVVDFFPELKRFVPQQKRLWEAQPYWLPMFEAVTLVLAAFKAR